MFIDFNEYPFTILDIKFDEEDIFDDYYQKFTLITDGNKDFVFHAIGDCCSSSVFRTWKNNDFDKLKGKIIQNITSLAFPDDFEFDFEDDDIYLSPHLYEIDFKDNDEKFIFMMVNYSNGYYDGWIETELIDK